jgi:hypothetical protein
MFIDMAAVGTFSLFVGDFSITSTASGGHFSHLLFFFEQYLATIDDSATVRFYIRYVMVIIISW